MNVTNLINKQYECYKLDKQTIWMLYTNFISKQYECYKLDE